MLVTVNSTDKYLPVPALVAFSDAALMIASYLPGARGEKSLFSTSILVASNGVENMLIVIYICWVVVGDYLEAAATASVNVLQSSGRSDGSRPYGPRPPAGNAGDFWQNRKRWPLPESRALPFSAPNPACSFFT